MNKEDLVVRFSTAISLIHSGLHASAIFSYYGDMENPRLELTQNEADDFLAPAYTTDELMALLPDTVNMNNEYFKWRNQQMVPYHSSDVAVLNYYRSAGGSFVAEYKCEDEAVYIRAKQDGKYGALFLVDDRSVECLAKLWLALKTGDDDHLFHLYDDDM